MLISHALCLGSPHSFVTLNSGALLCAFSVCDIAIYPKTREPMKDNTPPKYPNTSPASHSACIQYISVFILNKICITTIGKKANRKHKNNVVFLWSEIHFNIFFIDYAPNKL